MARIGAALNEEWQVNASHSLYDKNGRWYHTLERFPGALFDPNGFVRFETREAYEHCSRLSINYATKSAHVSGIGISDIPDYVRVRA